MLAFSDPDPALGFPAGTTVQPKVFIRNASGKAFTAHIRFNWRSATASGKSAPLDLAFKPNETRVIDVAALQAQKLLPADAQWAAAILSAPVLPDDLLAVAASYDPTGRYGTQTPFSDQLASHWEAGKWEVDSTHNSLVTVGNGGNKPALAQLTILYNQGSGQYLIEQMLAPDEQMWLDFGKLIHDLVPGKDGNSLPLDLASGTYRIRDLSDSAAGGLYEGKVTLDKTYGHAAYGCSICCGYEDVFMEFNPLAVAVNGSFDQEVEAGDSCGGGTQNITTDFPTWWTGNTAIATASGHQINGVAAGTTPHYAQSVKMYFGPKEYSPTCPLSSEQPIGSTNVIPMITSFDPNPIMIGVSNTTLTINGSGFGTDPTVNLPSGVTSTGYGATDSKIILQGVSVALSATVGNNNVTVEAGGQTSPKATLTVDGPYQMVVQSDILGHCTGCQTTVERRITYQINNFSGTPAQNVWIGEVVSTNGWSCTQSNPGLTTTPCSQNDIKSNGIFTDSWYLNSDSYTPVGCGFNVASDNWQWCAHSPAQTLGVLQGYVHTNAISENGVVSPPNSFPPNTVIPF